MKQKFKLGLLGLGKVGLNVLAHNTNRTRFKWLLNCHRSNNLSENNVIGRGLLCLIVSTTSVHCGEKFVQVIDLRNFPKPFLQFFCFVGLKSSL